MPNRVINRARENWSASVPDPPVWKKHKLKQTKRPVRELLADEESKLDEIESRESAGLREFAETMGLRRRELLLTWPQVDFDEATIAIIEKGNKPAGHTFRTSARACRPPP